jgi:hypothetical protein
MIHRDAVQQQLSQILASIEAQDFSRVQADLQSLCHDLDVACRPVPVPGESRITWVPGIVFYRTVGRAAHRVWETARSGDWLSVQHGIRRTLKRLPSLYE